MRSKITSYRYDGRTLVRAHVWAGRGYSTRAFNTAGEAEIWIRQKTAE